MYENSLELGSALKRVITSPSETSIYTLLDDELTDFNYTREQRLRNTLTNYLNRNSLWGAYFEIEEIPRNPIETGFRINGSYIIAGFEKNKEEIPTIFLKPIFQSFLYSPHTHDLDFKETYAQDDTREENEFVLYSSKDLTLPQAQLFINSNPSLIREKVHTSEALAWYYESRRISIDDLDPNQKVETGGQMKFDFGLNNITPIDRS